MMCTRRSVSCVASMLLLTTSLAWAQGTAQLNGKVTDETGAMPGRRHGDQTDTVCTL